MRFWTDGGCYPNPGRGGWGWTNLDGAEEYGGEKKTTNQRMELTAVLKCLTFCSVNQINSPLIVSDSQYVINGCTGWRTRWEKKGWKIGGGKEVKNLDLWRLIFQLSDDLSARFQWVRGHSGDPGNERADELARIGSGVSDEEIRTIESKYRRKGQLWLQKQSLTSTDQTMSQRMTLKGSANSTRE